MKTISDELFSLLVSYHLTGDKNEASEKRINTLLTQKIESIANRNRWQKEHKKGLSS